MDMGGVWAYAIGPLLAIGRLLHSTRHSAKERIMASKADRHGSREATDEGQ
jgi:hypothetical protein